MVCSNFKDKLDEVSFQSLSKLGIDWKKYIEEDLELKNDYDRYLVDKSNWIILNIDYSQLEFYVLASLSKDKDMIAMVNSGRDIHSENTRKLTGIDYLELERKKKLLSEDTIEYLEILAEIKAFNNKRKTVKAFTFSLTYGAGDSKVSMDLGISLEEARKLIDDFYRAYPGVKIWQNTTFLNAIKTGYIETPFGRRRSVERVKGRMDAYRALVEEKPADIKALKKAGEYWSLREEFKQCKNTPVQSTATDMCSLAACKIKEWLKTSGYRAEFYFWVHDSIVIGCHIDDAVDVIEHVRTTMENDVKYDGDLVNYRAALDVGFNYEWTVEVKREEWLNATNKRALLEEKLTESLDQDKNKKFKLMIKSSALALDDNYTTKISKMKKEYFEKLVEKLNIPNIHSPKDYMCWLNNCSQEEYDDFMELETEDDEE